MFQTRSYAGWWIKLLTRVSVSSRSRGPTCPTWPKTLWSEFSRWSQASGWRPVRPSSTPGLSPWRPPPPWRTCSAASLRTSWSAPPHVATALSLLSPRAPAAPPSPTKPAGSGRRSCASWTAATSSSTTAKAPPGRCGSRTLTRSFINEARFKTAEAERDEHRLHHLSIRSFISLPLHFFPVTTYLFIFVEMIHAEVTGCWPGRSVEQKNKTVLSDSKVLWIFLTLQMCPDLLL